MAFFCEAAIATKEALDHPEATIFLGKPEKWNRHDAGFQCIRNLHWKPNQHCRELLPLIFQTVKPIEVFRGVSRSEGQSPDLQADTWRRDGMSLVFPAKGFCEPTFETIRTAEKMIEAVLKTQGDQHGFLRQAKIPDDSLPPAPSWLGLRPNVACAAFLANPAKGLFCETTLSELHERTGLYQLTFQAACIIRPRISDKWKVTFTLRSAVLNEGVQDLQMYRLVGRHTEGLRAVSREELRRSTKGGGGAVGTSGSATVVESTPPVAVPAPVASAMPPPTQPPKKVQPRKRKAPPPPPAVSTGSSLIEQITDEDLLSFCATTPPVKDIVSGRRAPTKPKMQARSNQPAKAADEHEGDGDDDDEVEIHANSLSRESSPAFSATYY